MIITGRLVFIHLPKTGGTFVTRMLADVHLRYLGPLVRIAATRRVAGRVGLGFRNINKHGGCAEIPPHHRGKPILGCIRDPYAHYVSQYEFGWWRDHPRPWWDWVSIRARYPQFPDVSFAEFLDICTSMFHRLPTAAPPEERLGFYTSEVVRCYFREPRRVFPLMDDAYAHSESWSRDVFPVQFMRTERLNHDLHDALVGLGYPPSRLAFILRAPKVLPPTGKPLRRPWRAYYTPDLKALVRHRDRLLFQFFPEYDS